MPKARKESSLNLYHVVIKGCNEQRIFEDDKDRKKFLEILEASLNFSKSVLLAWCLMENHVHLLLYTPKENMAKCMMRLENLYARYFNRKMGRRGHLFHDRYFSSPIEDESYLLSTLKYIHQNPEHAHIAKTQHYKWSSYKEYLGEQRICATEFLSKIFQNTKNYVAFNLNSADLKNTSLDKNANNHANLNSDMVQKIALEVMSSIRVDNLSRSTKEVRDFYVRKLKAKGLSIKQIQRLTGLGKKAIANA